MISFPDLFPRRKMVWHLLTVASWVNPSCLLSTVCGGEVRVHLMRCGVLNTAAGGALLSRVLACSLEPSWQPTSALRVLV